MKLSRAETDLLAEHWFRQKDRPQEPKPEPFKLVPFSELPEAGAGAIMTAAIRGELSERGYTPGLFHLVGPTKTCMNCGESKPARYVDDGWCLACVNR